MSSGARIGTRRCVRLPSSKSSFGAAGRYVLAGHPDCDAQQISFGGRSYLLEEFELDLQRKVAHGDTNSRSAAHLSPDIRRICPQTGGRCQ